MFEQQSLLSSESLEATAPATFMSISNRRERLEKLPNFAGKEKFSHLRQNVATDTLLQMDAVYRAFSYPPEILPPSPISFLLLQSRECSPLRFLSLPSSPSNIDGGKIASPPPPSFAPSIPPGKENAE